MIHKLADCMNQNVPESTKIWQFCVVFPKCKIGENCNVPRSKNKDWTLLKTRVCKGATIGAGSVILPGITIGENAFIAAGSVVTKDVPAGELWMGNPARFYREVDF